MPVTNFVTANGQVLCETTTGSGTVYYHPDALGNVTCASQGKTVQKATYTPYGQGTRPAMAKLGWVGAWGYYPTNLSTPSHYVRARHFDNLRGIWATRDLLWPRQSGYGYVNGRLIVEVDPSGLWPTRQSRTVNVPTPPPLPPQPLTCSKEWNEYVFGLCWYASKHTGAQGLCNYYASAYYQICRKPSRGCDTPQNWVPMGKAGIAPEPFDEALAREQEKKYWESQARYDKAPPRYKTISGRPCFKILQPEGATVVVFPIPLGACYACCQRTFTVSKLISDCEFDCWTAFLILTQNGINQFEPPQRILVK